MPSKSKPAGKAGKITAKPAAKKPSAKKTAPKKSPPKPKATARPVAKKATTKAPAKKSAGVTGSVKHGVQVAIQSVAGLVKKVTPDALRPKSAKTKRK